VARVCFLVKQQATGIAVVPTPSHAAAVCTYLIATGGGPSPSGVMRYTRRRDAFVYTTTCTRVQRIRSSYVLVVHGSHPTQQTTSDTEYIISTL
jgi:hypothetical protein